MLVKLIELISYVLRQQDFLGRDNSIIKSLYVMCA